MTGTPGEDGGSHAGKNAGSRDGEDGDPRDGEDGGSRDGETGGGSPGSGRGRSVEGGPVRVPARDRWEPWLARARELGAATWRVAKRLWVAARPVLDQLRWAEVEAPFVTLVDRRAAPTLRVPAQGQVYHFVVQTTFTWTTNTARPELFGWYVDQFQPQAMQRLRRLAVRCAADVPPDRPRAFALALDDAMAGDDAVPWSYERGEVTFTCEPDVSVHLDEPVRELLRPYWDKRIALEWKRDLERRRAEYAEEQRARRPADAPENGAAPSTGMPEALREEHPPRQREAGAGGAGRRPADQGQREAGADGAGRRPAEQGQREARTKGARRAPRPPDSPVEQFTPLEPFLPPTAHPAPGPRPAPPQSGEAPSGDPDSSGPPDA
ncbi:hypothetical protein [Micromonospora sp. MA102]|uniref:hypothetical protein n=1 Tax=Micromonospora sp. MA102 TaxID=2952755 RepID=UPI0021C68DF7|nr:hypothetical protein [Micromonospora sp. MA102]